MDELSKTIVAYHVTDLADAIADTDGITLGVTDSELCERALRHYAESLLKPIDDAPPEQAEAA
jgi:hypothetical protein